jgi:hypothetical protein
LTRLGPFSATNSPRHHAVLMVSRSSVGDTEGVISPDQYLAISINDKFRPNGIGNITPPQGVRIHDGQRGSRVRNPPFGDQPSRAKSIQPPLLDRCNIECS